MRITRYITGLLFLAGMPCIASAQSPAPSMRPEAALVRRATVRAVAARFLARPMMMPSTASMFLECTGDLNLSDAQVTRLAAIARRSEARNTAMQARFDSALAARAASVDGDGGGQPAAVLSRLSMLSDAERRAVHDDTRDAIAVLTPDQLASAWDMLAGRAEMTMWTK